MRLQDIDKNFVIGGEACVDGLRKYTIPNEQFGLYGVYFDKEEKCFVRLSNDVAKTVNEGVESLYMHTAGGRVRFCTNSTKFELTVEIDGFWIMSHMTIAGQAGFMLLEETPSGETKFVKMLAPTSNQQTGFTISVDYLRGGEMRNYILWFPLYNGGRIKNITIGLDENAKVTKGREYRDILPILYYGSSITQGGCASRPDNCYQALISKWNNVDFINMGFSGSAKGEDSMVDYLASIDCSLFVCDYDYNAPSIEHLENTHYCLYERYRAARPTTPILFVSAPDQDEPHVKRMKIVRETYRKAKATGDKNVYFLNGQTLFGKTDVLNCTVDYCHPNDLGFYRMAKKIYKKMIEIDKKFE